MAKPKKKKKNKHNASPKVFDGIKFASTAEARRYSELKLMQKSGDIDYLYLQPRFLIQPKFRYLGKNYQAIHYTPDFMYFELGKITVEEYKSEHTVKDAAYIMRKKMLLHKFATLDFPLVPSAGESLKKNLKIMTLEQIREMEKMVTEHVYLANDIYFNEEVR